MDKGPEITSSAVTQWVGETERIFIPPGYPWRNEFLESFKGKFRNECLSVNHFCSLNHAKDIIGLWQEECKAVGPH